MKYIYFLVDARRHISAKGINSNTVKNQNEIQKLKWGMRIKR
jgi:hypothetical protein